MGGVVVLGFGGLVVFMSCGLVGFVNFVGGIVVGVLESFVGKVVGGVIGEVLWGEKGCEIGEILGEFIGICGVSKVICMMCGYLIDVVMGEFFID